MGRIFKTVLFIAFAHEKTCLTFSLCKIIKIYLFGVFSFAMGGPLLVTFSNIYLTKLEKDQVKPLKPKFYRRFVDDVISRRLKNTHDSLFEKLNNYHEKINFTIETNPKFLDTRLLLENDNMKTEVY